ncbi:phospholipase D-like domain-containing protein, partial [Domibacillus tundrae]|uniref:phospholipase D-like domain-containing protein n=1 Tax=Domibacillus tundrae TaxID=1587527 RepID=UPI003396F96B
LYNVYKKPPQHISYESEKYRVLDEDVQFYYNISGEKNGEKFFKEEIFARTLDIIDEAEQFIVMDYFLFNSYHEKEKKYPEITKIIAGKLLEKKAANPDMPIIFISDEVNTSYNSHDVPEFEEMKKAGIEIILTNMDPLRDSTPIYSGIYRMLFAWFGQGQNGWLPNAISSTAPDMTVRSYLKLFNVKANHRKTITTEQTTLISSANPQDASARFANVAFEVKGALTNDMLKSEKAAADTRREVIFPELVTPYKNKGDLHVRLLTEGKIGDQLHNELAKTKKGDEIWMAMFYLADRTIVKGLTEATKRGVEVKLVLDTNKILFGKKALGLPNMPVTDKLLEDSDGKIDVRWFAQKPEQFHPKMIFIKRKEESVILSGSANHTSRNLNDFNLETDVWIQGSNESDLINEVENYFHMIWKNKDYVYTVDYKEHYQKTTPLKRLVYSLQEIFHFTTY